MALIIDGQEHHCKTTVHDWRTTGLEIIPPRGARIREKQINSIVLHWTGGEGDPERVFKTLQNRKLGVEFCIGRQGEIFQFCDPALVDTYDAGWFNRRSIGIEIVNYGFRTKQKIPKRGLMRKTTPERINGMRIDAAQFFPEQICSVFNLIDSLTEAIQTIPRALPYDRRGNLHEGALNLRELKNFVGVLGHFHITRKKLDPGLAIFDCIANYFARTHNGI